MWDFWDWQETNVLAKDILKKEIISTADGSHTIAIPEIKVTYHSVHGAIQESRHVFLEAGLHYVQGQRKRSSLTVFEMGFGTGLNAFLTAIHAAETQLPILYTAVEMAPLSAEEASLLNYPSTLGHEQLFGQLHAAPCNEEVKLHQYFTLEKVQTDFAAFVPSLQFDLVYYDAFAPSAQPEFWTKEVFEKLYALLKANGVLVTYCSIGDVRRAMMAAGFAAEKLPGPPRKREMLRAVK